MPRHGKARRNLACAEVLVLSITLVADVFTPFMVVVGEQVRVSAK